jgi:hypothetical protein
MIRNNLHFAVLREGKGKAANVGAFYRLNCNHNFTAHHLVSSLTRDTDKYRGSCL